MPSGIYDRAKSKPNSGWFKKCHPSHNKGKSPSIKTRIKMSKNHADFTGSKHPRWNGGKRKTAQGYFYIYSPNHPYKNLNNCVKRSRLVMESAIGRYLRPSEIIHHINEIKDDDRIENLQLLPNKGAHSSIHNKIRSGENHWTKRIKNENS